MENISKEKIQSALKEIKEMMESGKSYIGREFVDMTSYLAYLIEGVRFDYPEEWYFIHRLSSSNYHRYEDD